MTISSNVKKQITGSWLFQFPDLTAYSQVKLYKVLGPVIIGLDLISVPRTEDYRPIFVIYPLWKENEKACLNMPVVNFQMRGKKGFQLDIPYLHHDQWKSEAFECVKKQALPLDRNITLHDIVEFAEFAYRNGFQVPIAEANIYELKLFSAVYTSNWPLTERILDDLYQVGSNWPSVGFDHVFGSFKKWYESLEEKVRNRDQFLSQISLNLDSPKLSKLKRSELLP